MSLLPRLALAAGSLRPPFVQYFWSDLHYGYAGLLAGGRVPYWDTPFYYPPLVGYLAGLFVRISSDAVGYVVLWGTVVAIVAAAVGWQLARSVGTRSALIYWSMSPQLLLVSGSNFDVVPAAAMLFAVLASRQDRPFRSLSILALGTLVKVVPIVLAPLELDRLWRSSRVRATAGLCLFAGISAAVSLPSLLAPWPSSLTAPAYAMRTSFDSIWGLAVRLLIAGGFDDAPALVGTITVAGLVATYAIAVVRRARRAGDPAVGAALAVIAFLFWTRLYSPQYALWILPLLALSQVDLRSFAFLVCADVLVFLTVPLASALWDAQDPATYWPVVAVAVAILTRQAALVRLWSRISPKSDGARAVVRAL